MSAWEIKNLWTANWISKYRSFAATSAPKRTGVLRSTCEDFALRLTIEFAEKNNLPIGFTNGAHPQGLTPNQFSTSSEFMNTVLRTTGASDLVKYKTAVLVSGASESKHSSLKHAKKGDLIILYQGGGHVQVVTNSTNSQVDITQGNFRPKSERCNGAYRFLTGSNQNDPNDSCYIGAIVRDRTYNLDTKTKKWNYGTDNGQTFSDHGRLSIWNFDAWNKLVVEHKVKAGESLSVLAAKYLNDGNQWNQIYATNQSVIGSDPNQVKQGVTLFIWKKG